MFLKNMAEPLELFKITQGFPHLELWLGHSELTSTLVIRKMQPTFTNNGQNLSFVQKKILCNVIQVLYLRALFYFPIRYGFLKRNLDIL